ncbi:jg11385 [Pararge aegeria aegeria]|uniref:Jg11385 protein n=2 Tax=Pararge aegeria TaxID=116150 RepID=A0A8S4RLI3_9NEOP|nr:jg11385 [Pararge aegeria aegeria]
MEVIQLLRKVKSLNDYASITQDMAKNISNLKVQFSMTTVLALKNIRSYELEQLYLKHKSIITCLVEKTGDFLLHLATRSELSIEQLYQILQCFNKYCGLASRDLRYALKEKFEIYFIQLASRLATCDDVCVQFTILETLVRWLLPRQDRNVRAEAVARWFPNTLYNNEAVQVFVEQSWLNFFSTPRCCRTLACSGSDTKDARSFINALNASNDCVVSVLCEKFYVGTVPIVTGKREHWLDFNCGSKRITLLLESTLYRALKVPHPSVAECAALCITADNTETAKMHSGPHGVLLSLKIIDPLKMFASKILENNYGVNIVISSQSNVQKVDSAMRNIFDKKYQEEDTRFSNPPEILRRKLLEERKSFDKSLLQSQIGSNREQKQRALASQQSPSSVSTSSLVLLRETLKAFPECQFDKEVERVSVRPQLQSVTEVTETEERQSDSSLSTAKLNHDGVGPTSSQSRMSSQKSGLSQNVEERKYGNRTCTISPNKNKAPASIIDLLAQEALQYSRLEDTLNTRDQSTDVVDKTFSATKTRSRRCDKREYNHKPTLICDETTGESSTAFVENTPAVHVKTANRVSTVTSRDKDKTKDSKDSGFGQTFDNKTIETFFFQHCSENKHGDLIISPTLAGRLMDSNLESCESFFLCPPVIQDNIFNFNYMEVIECLNSLIDVVCDDLDKHVEYLSEHLDKNNTKNKDTIEAGLCEVPLEVVTNILEGGKKIPARKSNRKTKPVKGIKLKFKNTKKQPNMPKRNNKLDLKLQEKKTASEEIVSGLDTSADNIIPVIPERKSTDDELKTPFSKRKRKLYSTKDENLMNAKVGIHVSETSEDNSALTECRTAHISPVPTATPYKELETLRKNAATRQLRRRKVQVLSPKTVERNSIFDRLKNSDNNEVPIVVGNKKPGDIGAVYEFTCSSEDDEDFKITKAITRNDSKKIRSGLNKSKMDTVPKGTSKDTPTVAKRTRSKSKLQISKKNVSPEASRELVDERMREATEVLNTSLIIESREEDLNIALEPAHKKPRMEIVPDDKECEIATDPMKKSDKRKENVSQRSKGKRSNNKKKLVNAKKMDDDTKTISPLPGLEIETAQKMVEADNSILMLERLNDKYEGNLDVIDLTQNLLSESEQVTNSPPVLDIIDDEFNKTVNIKNRLKCGINNTPTGSDRLCDERLSSCSNVSVNKEMVVVVDKLDIHSAKSILTTGSSPITAHGVLDETPPQLNEIHRRINPRSLETQDFSEDVIDYYNKLTDDLHASKHNRGRRFDSNKSQESKAAIPLRDYNTRSSNNLQESGNSNKTESVSETSPQKHSKIITARSSSVSITRLSQKEIDRYISTHDNSSLSVSITRLSQKEIDRYVSSCNSASLYSKSEESVPSPKDHKINEKNAKKVRKSTISPIILKDFNIKEKSMSSAEENPSKTADTSTTRKVRRDDQIATISVAENKKSETNNKSMTEMNDIQPSSSSVDKWLYRNERHKQSNTEEATLKEVLLTVQEKLDTTLHEIHLNASKSLIKMLAQTHSELNSLSAEREELFQRTVEELDGIINGKFAMVDSTLKEKNEKFMADFKAITRKIIVEEARKKSDFVKLLKEDIQAALNPTIRCDDGDGDSDD